MRNDIRSMSTGRCMAQASHASNAFIKSFGKNKLVNAWQKQTSQGFGTAIVLSVNLSEIIHLQTICKSHGYIFDKVIDPEYSYIVSGEIYPYLDPLSQVRPAIPKSENGDMLVFRKEITCAYAFGDRDDEMFKSAFSKYNLYA